MDTASEKPIKVISAHVITGRGTDQISLTVDLPNAIESNESVPNAHFKLEATAGSGPEWVRKNIGIEPTVVSLVRLGTPA